MSSVPAFEMVWLRRHRCYHATQLNSTPFRQELEWNSMEIPTWSGFLDSPPWMQHTTISTPLTLSLPSSSIRTAPLPPSPRSSVLSVALSCSSPDVLIALTCTMWWSQRSFAGFFSLSLTFIRNQATNTTTLLQDPVQRSHDTIDLAVQRNSRKTSRQQRFHAGNMSCHTNSRQPKAEAWTIC